MTQVWMADEDTIVINVDMTYDFLPPDGALPAKDGLDIIPVINEIVSHFREGRRLWTKEEHDKHHDFFASSRSGKKPFDTVETPFGTQFLWPDHCVEGSKGQEFHEDLDVKKGDMVVVKGKDKTIHAYSAFYLDDRKTVIKYEDGKTLTQKLKEAGIKKVVVTGLLYDFCAGLTAYDAKKEGFDVYFVSDASKSLGLPVKEGGTTINVMDKMFKEAGVKVVTASELPRALGKSGPGWNSGPKQGARHFPGGK